MFKIYIFLFVLVLATTPLPVCARADAAPHAAQSAPSGNGGLGDQLRQFKGYPHLDMAYRKMRAGENSAAAEEFRQYLAIIPQDAKARADFMNLLYRMGEYDAALALLQGQPDTQKIFALQQTRGMVLVKLGDNDQALAAFATALDAAGTDAERIAALRALVLVGKQDGDEEVVARYLTQARALAPDDEDLLREQALFYEHKGNYKEAVRLSARLEKLHPGPENAAVLANSLFLASRYAEAAAVYAKIAAKEPQMLYRAGQSFAAAHQEQQAIDMFTAFLRTGVSPLRKAETLLALGNIYATQGDAPQAYAAFHEAAPLAAALPQKAQAQLAAGLAFAAMGSGKPAEAVAPLQTALPLGRRPPAQGPHARMWPLRKKALAMPSPTWATTSAPSGLLGGPWRLRGPGGALSLPQPMRPMLPGCMKKLWSTLPRPQPCTRQRTRLWRWGVHTKNSASPVWPLSITGRRPRA